MEVEAILAEGPFEVEVECLWNLFLEGILREVRCVCELLSQGANPLKILMRPVGAQTAHPCAAAS